VEHVVGEGPSAENADGGKDKAEDAALLGIEAIAEEEREAGAEHGAGEGDAGEFWQGNGDAFHGRDLGLWRLPPRADCKVKIENCKMQIGSGDAWVEDRVAGGSAKGLDSRQFF
jgi:hypothetical protein